MAIQTRTYPIVESVINLLGDWFKHTQEMRELREINSVDFARIAHDLCVTPAELDTFVRRGSHASDELPRLLKSLGIDAVAHPAPPSSRHDPCLRCMPPKGQV